MKPHIESIGPQLRRKGQKVRFYWACTSDRGMPGFGKSIPLAYADWVKANSNRVPTK